MVPESSHRPWQNISVGRQRDLRRLPDSGNADRAFGYLKRLAQIKSVVEDKVLESETLTLGQLHEAAVWLRENPNAPWSHGLRLTLLGSNHMADAGRYIRSAIKLEPKYFAAYADLAQWSIANGDEIACNDIELELAETLEAEPAKPSAETKVSIEPGNGRWTSADLPQALSISYANIALFYEKAERYVEARHWILKRVELHGEVFAHCMLSNIEVLDKTERPDAHAIIVKMLHRLYAHRDPEESSGADALTMMLYRRCLYPTSEKETWLRLYAEAAKVKGELDWLADVWERVMTQAKQTLYKAVFIAKTELLYLYRDYLRDLEEARKLSRELCAVTSTWCADWRMDLERAKEMLGC